MAESVDLHIPDALPILPLRDAVVFPGVAAPIAIGQARSLGLIDDVKKSGHPLVALMTQRSTQHAAAEPEDLHRVGSIAIIHELDRVDNVVRMVAHGVARIRVIDFTQTHPYLVARIELAHEPHEEGVELDALARTVKDLFARIVELAPEIPDEIAPAAQGIGDPKQLAYIVASAVPLSTANRQEILELDRVSERLNRLIALLQHEVAVRELMNRIAEETTEEMTKAQREHVLRAHLESIQRALDELDPAHGGTRELREKLLQLPLPDEARKEAMRELERLERTPEASPEHGIIRTYVEWMAKMPWGKRTGAHIDVARARAVLDEDHHDLEKVKDRIVDYLAVQQLRETRKEELEKRNDKRGDVEPILCFVGPPGVGKTSLGQSIARAMGRPFVHQSLGGVHDEAEIRGHRRTYIGAMPGRIAQALARAETSDPVFMLDEIDKLGVGFHGDPAAALLELLDPAENHAFVDTYLGVPFDLSHVLFICTANTTDTIPPPLLDRMEMLTLSGYPEQEKLQIARRFLLPKRCLASGLRDDEVVVPDETLTSVIGWYTREAGVRGFERTLATILRKAARRITEGASAPIRVEPDDLHDYLGPRRFFEEASERIDRPGIATGLSWTPAGGQILFVEATMIRSAKDRLVLTGMLGNVMRESAEAALTYLRANAERLGIDPREVCNRRLVHIHVPAGAIPKDGPSAGLTMLVALASHALGRPIHADVAMTGEVTLRGRVLPVGGIKEKVLAAHRAGLHTVILPRLNEGDLEDVPEAVRQEHDFVFVDSVDEALAATLDLQPPTESVEHAPSMH